MMMQKPQRFLVYGANDWVEINLIDILANYTAGTPISCLADMKVDMGKYCPNRAVYCVARTHGRGKVTINCLKALVKLLNNLSSNVTAPVWIAHTTFGTTIRILYVGSEYVLDHHDKRLHGRLRFTQQHYPTLVRQYRRLLACYWRWDNCLNTGRADGWLTQPSDLRRVTCITIHSVLADNTDMVSTLLPSRTLKEASMTPMPVTMAKVILVTGGAGFIGSNFINFWINASPADTIVNFDCLEPHSNLKNIENSTHRNYTFVKGNLTDRESLDSLFRKFAFTHIVHFAAASNVDQSFTDPVICTLSNVVGTQLLLESCRTCTSLKLFLYISTDEVYGETPVGHVSCREDTAMFAPTNPYAASKAAAECLVMSYGKSFNIPWIITRANNVYGRYQYPSQAIPRFITCLLKGNRMPVHGTGQASRRFLHVTDKCRAVRLLMERGTVGEVYNIGSTNEVTVMKLCERLMKVVLVPTHGRKGLVVADWVEYVRDRCYNDCRYAVDTRKLEALGWEPEVSFEEGLNDTVQWYRENRNHWTKDVRAEKPGKAG